MSNRTKIDVNQNIEGHSTIEREQPILDGDLIIPFSEALSNAIATGLEKDRQARRAEESTILSREYEDHRSAKLEELEKIPLENLTGYQRRVVEAYPKHILHACTAAYKPPYSCVRTAVFLRLSEDVPKPDTLGSEDLTPHVALEFDRRELALIIKGFNPIRITYVEVEGIQYIELCRDEESCLAASAFLAYASKDYEPFYGFLVEWVTRLFPFKPGEVNLSGYDDVVEICNRVLRCGDPRLMKRHILLAGPPGCGKSMIAKRVVNENPGYVSFYLDRGRLGWFEFFSKVLQKCGRRMLLVIDEIDELGLSRSEEHSSVYELLRLMDGAADTRNLTILATTNRLQVLDEALLRPGRFGPVINVKMPNQAQISQIVEHYNQKYCSEVNPEALIKGLSKLPSGAYIRLAMENCIILGEEINIVNVARNLEAITQ